MKDTSVWFGPPGSCLGRESSHGARGILSSPTTDPVVESPLGRLLNLAVDLQFGVNEDTFKNQICGLQRSL